MPINPYASQSIAGYNSSPPPDDGSQTEANKVEWAKHKEKHADPIKALAEAINSQAVSAFNAIALEDWSTAVTTATIAESDWHNGILMTASGRVNYPDPTTLENGWHNYVFNGATANIKLAATATNYFRRPDGQSASEVVMYPGEVAKVWNTSTQWLVAKSPRPLVLGLAYSYDGALVSATGLIPADNTIPQATEGTQVLSVSYQPSDIGNLMEVKSNIYLSATGSFTKSIAAFATSVLSQDAIVVGTNNDGVVNGLEPINVRTWVTSTTTQAYVFTVRIGTNTGNAYMGGILGGARFGGTLLSWVEVTEYEI